MKSLKYSPSIGLQIGLVWDKIDVIQKTIFEAYSRWLIQENLHKAQIGFRALEKIEICLLSVLHRLLCKIIMQF